MGEIRNNVSVDSQEALKNIELAEAKKLLEFYLGSTLHEDWKKDDEQAYEAANGEKKDKNWEKGNDGVLRKFKSVDGNIDGKPFIDTTFSFDESNPAHRKSERKVDIRGLSFAELPIVWQKENADAGKVAVDLVFDKIMKGEKIDIEEIASQVHDAWLSRPNNAWAKEYQSEESKPYSELSPEVQQKDRRQVELAIQLVEKFKSGEITLEDLRTQIGPAMNRYESQLKQIEAQQK